MKLSYRRGMAGVLVAFAVGAWSGAAQAADPTNGQKLYNRHCTNCHGDRGRPILPGVPDFSRHQGLMQPDRNLIATIKSGKGVMPSFKGLLTDDEMLDVVAYLRTMI